MQEQMEMESVLTLLDVLEKHKGIYCYLWTNHFLVLSHGKVEVVPLLDCFGVEFLSSLVVRELVVQSAASE